MISKRVLVTGGAGFIGSHLVKALVQRGARVRVFDDFSTGLLSNLNSVRKDVEVIRGNICDFRAVDQAVKKNNYVFHVAAIRAVERSVDRPEETHAVNVTGTLNVLLAAQKRGVKRVIFSSSSSVYGDTKKFPSSEQDSLNPVSPYAVSKMMGEHYCRLFSNLYGLETVSLRYFNVFGPYQNPESKYSLVIPMFLFRLLRNQSPEVHWDGRQSRDFAYVDNIVHGNLLASSCPRRFLGDVFNISTHEEHSVLDIFNKLKRMLNRPSIQPKFSPKRPGDVRRTLADISKAKRMLSFRVQTKFNEGLNRTVEWFLESGALRKIQL